MLELFFYLFIYLRTVFNPLIISNNEKMGASDLAES